MKKNTLLNTVWVCIEAVLLLTLGVLTIVYAKNVDAWNVIGYITGALILLDGLLRIIVFVLTRSINISKAGLYRGVFEVTFGVFLLIRPEIVVTYFTLLIAIGLVVVGTVCFVECVIANVRRSLSTWPLVISYVGSAALIALGIVSLIYYPYDLSKAGGTNTISIILIAIGILFIIGAFVTVIGLIVANKKEAKIHEEEGEEIAKKRSAKREQIKAK